jgi:hypothetical protein
MDLLRELLGLKIVLELPELADRLLPLNGRLSSDAGAAEYDLPPPAPNGPFLTGNLLAARLEKSR